MGVFGLFFLQTATTIMGEIVDHSGLISLALTTIVTLFVWWVRSEMGRRLAELKGDIDLKIKQEVCGVSSQYTISMEHLRDRLEQKLVETIEDKFVRVDVYQSDKDKSDQRFVMLGEIINLKIQHMSSKLDDIATRLTERAKVDEISERLSRGGV